MKQRIFSFLAVAGAALTSAAPQGCPDNAHKVASMPYWNQSETLPCMYAGSLASTEYLAAADHNLFYWLFRNPTQQATTPLVIWINGGPGATSMFGLFAENGPLRVQRTGPGADDFVIGLNPQGSWADVGDILFIDQPVGTGFSFTSAPDAQQTFVTTMQQAGDEFLYFLRTFNALHPDYALKSGRSVTLSGESYAGKYIPYFATRLVNDGKDILQLDNVLIGNPYTSPVNQRTATHKVAQALNIIDSYNMDQIAALRRKCERAVSASLPTSGDACTETLDYILAVGGGVFDKDARLFDYEYGAGGFKQPYQDYFTKSGKLADIL